MDDHSPKHKESPYSLDVLDLYEALKATKNIDDRRALMMELAEMIASEHDDTDAGVPDGYHAHIEEFEKSRQAYSQNGIRLARLTIQVIETINSIKGLIPNSGNQTMN